MRPGTPRFVAGRLIEAREARGMTAISVADAVGVSREAVSKWERGESTPQPDNLRRLTQVLNVPVHRFMKPMPPTQPKVLFFRSMNTATKGARIRAERRFDWLREIVSFASHHVNLPAVNVPRFDVPSDPAAIRESDIEQMATQTRRHWGLGDRPISNVVWLLENNGVVLARHLLGADTLDAFSEWGEDDRPYCILGSEKASAARSRFDVAHELAHLVFHHQFGPKYLRKTDTFRLMENQAHSFAGAFLLPAETFGHEVVIPSLDGFRSFKEKWKVSVGAMIKRSAQLGIIDSDQERRLWLTYNRRGWRRDEPLDRQIVPEEPRLLRRAFDLLMARKLISPYEIEANLGLPLSDVEQLIGLPHGFWKDADEPDVSMRFPAPEQRTAEPDSDQDDVPPIFRLNRAEDIGNG